MKYTQLKIGDSVYLVDTIHRKNTSVKGLMIGKYVIQTYTKEGYPATHEGIAIDKDTTIFPDKETAKQYLCELFQQLVEKL